MASKGDREFLDHAVRLGFLRAEELPEIETECAELARFLGRVVPIPHFVLHRRLTPDQVDEVCAALRRRVVLCPECWTRLNVHGRAPGQTLACSQCHARLIVAADPHAEVLEPELPGVTVLPRPAERESTATDIRVEPATPRASPGAGPGAPPGSFRLPGFEIIQRVDHGELHLVFKARHRASERLVAIKVLPPSLPTEAPLVRRFYREARALERIPTPGPAYADDPKIAPLCK